MSQCLLSCFNFSCSTATFILHSFKLGHIVDFAYFIVGLKMDETTPLVKYVQHKLSYSGDEHLSGQSISGNERSISGFNKNVGNDTLRGH